MATGERLQVVTAKDLLQRPMTRRTLLVGLATAGALAGCDGGEPQPKPSLVETSAGSLKQENRLVLGIERTVLVDKALEKKPEDGFETVVFFYNSAYEGGSIDVALSLPANPQSLLRVVSEEKSPRPGYLVDQISTVEDALKDSNPAIKHPVIQLASGDQEVVFLATGNTVADTQRMRAYALTSMGGGSLEGSFNGHATIAHPLQLRD